MPRKRAESPANTTLDVAAAVDALRELVGRTEALALATEELLSRDPWGVDEGADARRRERLAHLLGVAVEAATTARVAGDQIAEALAAERTET